MTDAKVIPIERARVLRAIRAVRALTSTMPLDVTVAWCSRCGKTIEELLWFGPGGCRPSFGYLGTATADSVPNPDGSHTVEVAYCGGNKGYVGPEDPGLMIGAKCRCGYTVKVALGSLSPKEGRCQHVFRFDPIDGPRGAFVCTNCTLKLGAEQIAGSGELVRAPGRIRFSKDGIDLEPGQPLSDTMGALRTELTETLADNARLRRRVEDLERKAKVRR